MIESLKSTTSWRGGVMYIAAAITSALLACSAAISVLKVIGVIWTVKPWSLPIAFMMSTMIPEISLVLVSRKVNGTPVGVEATRTTCWATLAPVSANPKTAAARKRPNDFASTADPRKSCDGGPRGAGAQGRGDHSLTTAALSAVA